MVHTRIGCIGFGQYSTNNSKEYISISCANIGKLNTINKISEDTFFLGLPLVLFTQKIEYFTFLISTFYYTQTRHVHLYYVCYYVYLHYCLRKTSNFNLSLFQLLPLRKTHRIHTKLLLLHSSQFFKKSNVWTYQSSQFQYMHVGFF